jgi:hypothetical protein
MSYTSTTTSVRPNGVLWFNRHDPINSMSLINWESIQPGFVSFNVVVQDANTLVSTLVFEDQASFDAMAAERATRADWIVRQEYCLVNGITKTIVRENT